MRAESCPDSRNHVSRGLVAERVQQPTWKTQESRICIAAPEACARVAGLLGSCGKQEPMLSRVMQDGSPGFRETPLMRVSQNTGG